MKNKFDSDEIVHIKHSDGVEYIQFKVLNKYNVKHCITLRHGGKSTGEYSSLNFRTLGNDNIKNVLENLNIIKEKLNFGTICKAGQDHTDKVIEINEENYKEYEFSLQNQELVDGYIVSQKDIATLITTADCNPIIIYDTKNNVVANVHAGWKGVINKIYINALDIMIKKYNSNVNDIVVCIGPSIRKCCFTSKEDSFKEKFTSVFENEEKYLTYDDDKETFHIDLIYILKQELKKAGINPENIHVADICTRCNTKDFYSYRYAVQNGKKDYATMATIVELNS